MWHALVELVRATIFTGTQLLGGSLGASIFVVSAVVRLALLPLALRAARQARAQQELLRRIQPDIERLRARYKADPRLLLEKTAELYRRNGIRVAPSSFAALLIQLPLLGALFSAVRAGLGDRVRFLWIADLGRVDVWLVAGVTGLTGLAVAMAPGLPSSASTRLLAAVAVGGTLVFLWTASSAMALSVGAGSAVSLFQSWMLRRDARAV
jgi:YidC/Oxa1 family membrane protein insertase